MDLHRKKVIYTTIVGGYDGLLEQTRYPGWDYVCFSDQQSFGWRTKLGQSCWKIVPFENSGLDNTRYSRLPKILPHRYLADYEYSVYIDGNAQLLQNPDGLLDQLDWPEFLTSEHPFRDNLYDEFRECLALGMDEPEKFKAQRDKYKNAGLPDPTQLMENNFLLRHHNALNIQALHEAWWQELLDQSRRDQLSLPYLCWKMQINPVLMDPPLKQQYFRTKAHYRSLSERLGRSIRKRIHKNSKKP
jgi:hypothetical protein